MNKLKEELLLYCALNFEKEDAIKCSEFSENSYNNDAKIYLMGSIAALKILEKKLETAIKTLEFYAPSNSYDYDITQGANYIWNDQGKLARQALKEIKEG